MSIVRRQTGAVNGAVLWSVALHVAVVVFMSLSFKFAPQPRVAATAAPIQGTIIDMAAIEREQQRREQAARAERQQRQREDRQRREAEQQRQREQQAAEQRVVAERQQREQAVQQERERAAAEQRRKEQVAREDAAKRAEAAKREAAAAAARRTQQQAEDQLQRELAAEADRMSAERSGLLDQYIRMIENQIERNWEQPLSAKAGLDCMVDVVQLPSGDVMSVTVSSCNGDPAVVRSIENAVKKASPLPKPPNPALFERNLRVRFQPVL
jgi:colicin import membrane protein